MKQTRGNLGWIGVILLFIIGLTSCDGGPPDDLRATPPPEGVSMNLESQAIDTFTVVSTWSPVVFLGDTIREFRRTVSRTDSTQDLSDFIDSDDNLQAVGSETFQLPGPGEGETGEYRYCLRSVRSNGVTGQDSTCANFQYTQPVDFPPPPDSLEVSPEQAVALDSVRILPDTVEFTFLTEAGKDSTTERRYVIENQDAQNEVTVDTTPEASIHMAAVLYVDGEVVGCDGNCDQFTIYPASWENGIPVYLSGRVGYGLGEEWIAQRLPWLRQLAG